MSSFVGFGDIAKCAKLMFKIYEYGFKSIHNASTQYIEFGQSVYGLHKNLLQLEGVFKNVEASARSPIPGNSCFYDTTDLDSILDEPFTTYRECEQLLARRDSFAEDGGAIRNVYWNAFIEAEVAILHKKVMFHNTKIIALLKPLELKLLLDIQSLVTHYGEAILRELEKQNARLFGNGMAIADHEVVRCNQIIIPPYLLKRFEDLSKDAKPATQTDETFPMHDGINAFLRHYQEDAGTADFSRGFLLSPPTQSPEQYVSVMRIIWIIQRVQRSKGYIDSCESGNRLLKCFVEDLAQKCLDVFNRYSDKPANPYKVRNEPSEMSLLPLGDEAFMIWPKAEYSYDRFDAAALDTMKTILQAPLLHLNPARQKALLLLRQSETVLEMITKETSESERISESRSQVPLEFHDASANRSCSRDIDLRVASLNPIYADPQSQTSGIDIGLYTLGARGRDDLLSFRSYRDLYIFQEAITGYRVIEDLINIDAIVMTDKATHYRARAQIWSFAYEPSNQQASPTPSNPSSRAASTVTVRAPIKSSTSNSTVRRASDARPPRPFSPRKTTLSSSPNSYSPSEWSSSSAKSVATTVSAVASLSDPLNSEVEANVFTVPREPLLVLFLRPKPGRLPTKSRDVPNGGIGTGGGLTLLKIPIGSGSAMLEKGNCTCPRSQECTHASISCIPKRTPWSDPLLVERVGGKMVNLAALGVHYGEKGEGSEKEKLNYVRLTFCAEAGRANEATEQKNRFETTVTKLQRVDGIRRDGYDKAKWSVKFGDKK